MLHHNSSGLRWQIKADTKTSTTTTSFLHLAMYLSTSHYMLLCFLGRFFSRIFDPTLAGFRKNISLHSWWESMIHHLVNNWGPYCIRDHRSWSSSFFSLLACYSNEAKQVTLVGFSCKLHSSVFGTIISFCCQHFDVIFHRFIYGYSRNDLWFVFVTVELGE